MLSQPGSPLVLGAPKTTSERVTILCSAVGLGVFIPAVLLAQKLRSLGISVQVLVLERLLSSVRRRRLVEARRNFGKNFELARISMRMAGIVGSHPEGEACDALLRDWSAEKRARFIVFSGFWVPIVERYGRDPRAVPYEVDACLMDSVVSPSWGAQVDLPANYHFVRLLEFAGGRPLRKLLNPSQAPLPYDERSWGVTVHGGGWGIGTSAARIHEMDANGIRLNIVAYDDADLPETRNSHEYYRIDPEWQPWEGALDSDVTLPPLWRVSPGKVRAPVHDSDAHGLFHVVRRSRAIVSKPGGMTLLDSLAAATPLVYLPALGEHERHNAELWERNGFGLSYENWQRLRYDWSVVRRMHENLLAASGRGLDYAAEYAERLGKGPHHDDH